MTTYQVRTNRGFDLRQISAKVSATSREKAALIFLEYYKENLIVGDTIHVAISKYHETIYYKVKKGWGVFVKYEILSKRVNRFLFQSYEIVLGIDGRKSADMQLNRIDNLIKKEEDYWDIKPEIVDPELYV